MKRFVLFRIAVLLSIVMLSTSACNEKEIELVVSAYQKIWHAIEDLQEQIDNIQLIPGPPGEQGPQGEQGPPGPCGIEVYDADDQFLGVLNFHDGFYCRIFLPNIKIFFVLDLDSGDAKEDIFFYDSQYCSGKMYMRTVDNIFKYCEDGNYYYGSGKPISITRQSARSCHDGRCTNYSSQAWVWQPTMIPEENIPFILPVKLPLRYDYGSD